MTQDASGLGRRDFILLAAAGATILAPTVGTAQAQDAPAAPETPAGGTMFTGDVIEGKKVISALDVADLEPGRHHFFFEGVQMVTGKHWYVSVAVIKGSKPGKRVALISGVHGDEISPVRTVQMVLDQLDPETLSGTVLAVLDVSSPALEAMARRWPSSSRGIDLVDMNREWPGSVNAPSAPGRQAGMLFERVIRPNADYAIDFHTAATGMDMSAFNLARMDIPEVKAMAELYPIDHIFDDPAYPTLLANACIDAGIPALTPEIGGPRSLDRAKIALFVEGTMNVLKLHGLVAGPMGRTGADSGLLVANTMGAVLSSHGGFVELLVELNEKVEAGQKVAIQRNAFGEIQAEYTSPVSGEVAARRTDATAEPGTPLLFFLFASPDKAGDEHYPE